MYQAVVDIIKREGILGLYSGLSSSLLGIAVTNGYGARAESSYSNLTPLASVYYYFYERSRGIILKSRGGGKGMNTLESILTGMIAGKYVLYGVRDRAELVVNE